MASLLALLSAATFGAGDFLGGLATRRSGFATTVVLLAHVVGFILLAILAPLFGLELVDNDLLWGILSGLAGAIGLVLLYRGLAIGSMSVVAPVTALGSAVVPVVYGLARGERPGIWAMLGAALALLAIYLVSQPAEVKDRAGSAGRLWSMPGLPEAVGAGFGFGLFFILLAETSSASGLLPLVAARSASVSALAILTLSLRRPFGVSRPAAPIVIAAGIFDAAANALFLAAARTGLLTLVAVLSALYPASTILLARVVLKERIGAIQQLGLATGLAGVVLIATG